jgi:hypothetical protein
MLITMGRQLAQDWPNLKKYQNENTTLQKQLLQRKSSFMGDSITEFWSISNPHFLVKSLYQSHQRSNNSSNAYSF